MWHFERISYHKFSLFTFLHFDLIRIIQSGAFRDELVPVDVQIRKETRTVSEDEEYKKVNFEKMVQLKPAFKPGGCGAINESRLRQ